MIVSWLAILSILLFQSVFVIVRLGWPRFSTLARLIALTLLTALLILVIDDFPQRLPYLYYTRAQLMGWLYLFVLNVLMGAQISYHALAGWLCESLIPRPGDEYRLIYSPRYHAVAMVIWGVLQGGLLYVIWRLAAGNNPLGEGFFYQSMQWAGMPLLVVRVMLGMLMPLLYGLIGWRMKPKAERMQAARTELEPWMVFLPALVMAVLGQVFSAVLTVGRGLPL